MRILIDEFITGGGLFAAPPVDRGTSESLRLEGDAMLRALATDFAAVDGVQPVVLRDVRIGDPALDGVEVLLVRDAPHRRRLLAREASRARWTIAIAPETDGALAAVCRLIVAAGGRLLGPPIDVVELAADKPRCAGHLAASGVPVPAGIALEPGVGLPGDFDYPAVLKPRDGAGSQGITFVRDARHARRLPAPAVPSRLEQFHAGQAVSAAVLCGPRGIIPLPACRQHLSDDGHFAYRGGSLPLAADRARRATSLAVRAAASLDAPLGYLGVDLVLGEGPSGHDDVVIEINPRLTTSYVGLRAALATNLAAAMLEVAVGNAPGLSFQPAPVEFESDGTVRTLTSPAQPR